MTELLIIFIVLPMIVIGLIQFVAYHLGGERMLRWTSLAIAALCVVLLVNEASAPPVYGHKSIYVGLGIAALVLILTQCAVALALPLFRRVSDWEKAHQERWAAWSKEQSERTE